MTHVLPAGWLIACAPPPPHGSDGPRGITLSTIDSGLRANPVASIRGLGFVDSGGELCLFGPRIGGPDWQDPVDGIAGYRIALDATLPPPDPLDPIEGSDGLVAVQPWVDDLCVAATGREGGSGTLLFAVGADGRPDPSFAPAPLGSPVTALARDGDALWVATDEETGPVARRFRRDGSVAETVPLPVAPTAFRVVADGFVLATTGPPAIWRTDRQGAPRRDFADEGRRWVRPTDADATVDLRDDGAALFFLRLRSKEEWTGGSLVVVDGDEVKRPRIAVNYPTEAVVWDGDHCLVAHGGTVERRALDGRLDASYGDGGQLWLGVGSLDVVSGRGGVAAFRGPGWWDEDQDWQSFSLAPAR